VEEPVHAEPGLADTILKSEMAVMELLYLLGSLSKKKGILF